MEETPTSYNGATCSDIYTSNAENVVSMAKGGMKCNTDGASKGNPGPSLYGFCLRDHRADIICAHAGALGHDTNIEAEAKAILEALKSWSNIEA
ncbi:hypothetical protein CQW23_12083 [Capsicum baccatum]|uniref:RNase H type-1 domain-containing protein n=1 Tax=Capsicum baccatum TaxID=33114 RepID=A0A2G2WRK0_CAPBA|nr:hypothetical protein CQW23_12083 [Capsicum baccatum]